MDGLVPGRIVYYVFDEASANAVLMQRVGRGGNPVRAGDVAPAMIVKVWDASGYCNLHVMLDGPDAYWATSVHYAEWTPEAETLPTPRTWHWMFSGQAKRYDPKPA